MSRSLRDVLEAVEVWTSADMWRFSSGPSTTKADMRLQARVINDEIRDALGLPRLPEWHWKDTPKREGER